MATISLQVNANTAAAVGAFNAFTQSVLASQAAVNNLTATVNTSAAANRSYAQSITQNLSGAFSRLWSLANTTYSILERIGAVTQFAFGSILKELDKIQGFQAIMSVSAKSADAVARSYTFLRETADRLGVQFDALTSNYAKLVASMPPGLQSMKDAERVFMGVAMAARTMHATNQDTQLMFYAVTQMASKGVVSMEELRRQLGEKLPGTLQIAAKAVGTTTDELEKAIRKGLVDSLKFLPAFGDAMIRQFAESSKMAATSVSAAINRLTNVWVDFVKEILDSGSGNAIVGVFDALREKLSDPYVIAQFSELIKQVATRITEFISKLTADDLRDGFMSAAKFISNVVEVLEKFVSLLNWIIQNTAKVGSVVGALGGAAVGGKIGALFGPVGAAAGLAVGGAIGLVGGYAAGQSLKPSSGELVDRAQVDAAAQASANAKIADQTYVRDNMLLPLLKQFPTVKLEDVKGLFEPNRLTRETVGEIVDGILRNKKLDTDALRGDALKYYSSVGIMPAAAGVTLKDVLRDGGTSSGGSKTKAPKIDNSWEREWLAYANAQEQAWLDKIEQDNVFRRVMAEEDQKKLDAYEREMIAQEQVQEHWLKLERDKEQAEKDRIKSVTDSWQKTWDQASQSLADAIMQGGKSAGEYLRGFFANLTLRPIIQGIMAPVTGLLSGAAAASQLGNYSGPMSGLGSLLSLVGGGGVQGSLLAGAGWMTGATSFSGAMGAAGSLMTSGTLAGAASGGLMSLGALAPYIGVAAMIYQNKDKIFGGEVKDLGISGNLAYGGTSLAGYKRTSGGWFGNSDTNATQLPTEIGEAFSSGTKAMYDAVLGYTEALGLPAEAVAGASYDIKMSTKDLSPEQIAAAINEQITQYGNTMAGGLQEYLAPYLQANETWLEALTRLSTALTSANAVMEMFLQPVFDISVEGAAAADSLITLAGGLEALTDGLEVYYKEFYTDSERLANTTGMVTDAMADLGYTFPDTRDGFRALVEGLDLTNEADRKLYVQLINLAGAADIVYDASEAASGALIDMSMSIDAFKSSLSGYDTYMQQFIYGGDEVAYATSQMNEGFTELGLAVPESRAQFIALTEGLDLNTESGRETYAALMDMADSADTVYDAAEAASGGLIDMSMSIDAFKGSLSEYESYMKDFVFAGDDVAYSMSQVNTVFTDLGLAVPSTRDGFVALVNSLDLTTEVGRATFAALQAAHEIGLIPWGVVP